MSQVENMDNQPTRSDWVILVSENGLKLLLDKTTGETRLLLGDPPKTINGIPFDQVLEELPW